ncbi:MAG: winged helix-turn-helix domain-containing protein, partial [Pirellulales bacterium]
PDAGPSDRAFADEWRSGADAVFGGHAGALVPRGAGRLTLVRPLSLIFDSERQQVRVADDIIQLSFEEFVILSELAARPYWPFTFQEVIQGAREKKCRLTLSTLDRSAATLREKLGMFGDYIQSVPGFGYRFRE